MVELLSITSSVKLLSRLDGLLISGVTSSEQISKLESIEPSVQSLLRSLPGLISEGIFSISDHGLFASIESLSNLESGGHDPLESIFNWSPYTLKIQHSGTIGYSDFKLIPRFLLGQRVIPLKREGVIAWRSKSLIRLPSVQAAALAVCDFYNSSPEDNRNLTSALSALQNLQLLANSNLDFELDEYLRSEQVVVPKSVGLGVEDDGRFATAFPKIEGVPEQEFRRQFLNVSEVQSVYNIETDKGRQRLLITPELQQVFRAIKLHGFGMAGQRREEFYRNPRSLLPESEGIDADLIDVIGFGPRVRGIGFPQFVRPLGNHSRENWFNRNAENEDREISTYEADVEFVNGVTERLTFESREQAQDFLDEMRATISSGESSFQWGDNAIPASSQLLQSFETAFNISPGRPAGERPEQSRSRVLLIHTNEEQIDYVDEIAGNGKGRNVELPKSLLPSITLKAHQVDGLRWLQNLVHNDWSKGALLADEMGLGKTLQLLCFAAWLIESEFKDQVGKPIGPYDPILIVAPLILVENWSREIDEYFESSVFSPIEILHGSSIKKYKVVGSKTRELEVERETLDLDKIRQNRVIITNYDTVKNYQYSFAKVPWSLVVVDEAQEIKEPSTSITHALKALNPLFKIASTGTPVETSLTNLWSVMDFAHAGNPLGSLRHFNTEFAGRDFDDLTTGAELRRRLRYNEENGFIRRRTKQEVLKDLPPKHFIIKYCDLDSLSIDLYNQIQETAMSAGSRAAVLQGLHQVSIVSQHPFLLEDNPFRSDYREYLTASSKLRVLISTLEEIKIKGEKVLVFTRSKPMQSILKHVVDRHFNLDVKILNGSTASRHKYVAETRSGIIESFSKAQGFQVLVLSPDVAGVGLTITAANHVVHYGRWWNPAKENQATDRAYRIGQLRPVFVYHLINRHPEGVFETFDEKLVRHLQSREDLADNFLAAGVAEGSLEEGLLRDLFRGPRSEKSISPVTNSQVLMQNLNSLSPFEFEALTAHLLSDRFRSTKLTPKTRDGGVDVIGISDREIVLIQCKHRLSSGGEADATEALEDLLNAQDYYREYLIPAALKHLPVKLMMVLSGTATKETLRKARDLGIELADSGVVKKLLSNKVTNLAHLKAIEVGRALSVSKIF